MATAALIPVSEYLTTTYRPDRDYIDGEVRERNLGETPHSGLQTFIALLFSINRKEWGLRSFTEQRVQISTERFRVPDVCALYPDGPPGGILRTAPELCIEILSPGDSLTDMQDRVDDYVALGVPHIWLIDPVKRRAWTADAQGIHVLATDAFTIPETPVRVPLADMYRELDDIAAGR